MFEKKAVGANPIGIVAELERERYRRTPRGEAVWVSVRDADEVQVYETEGFKRLAELPAEKPSGIFFASRAFRTGL